MNVLWMLFSRNVNVLQQTCECSSTEMWMHLKQNVNASSTECECECSSTKWKFKCSPTKQIKFNKIKINSSQSWFSSHWAHHTEYLCLAFITVHQSNTRLPQKHNSKCHHPSNAQLPRFTSCTFIECTIASHFHSTPIECSIASLSELIITSNARLPCFPLYIHRMPGCLAFHCTPIESTIVAVTAYRLPSLNVYHAGPLGSPGSYFLINLS